MNLAWWPHTTNANIASYRLRCLRIMEALGRGGLPCSIWRPGGPAPSVLVLSKRYDGGSLQRALELRRVAGTRLVLDICDNHFYSATEGPSWQHRADELRRAATSVDTVVTSTEALRQVVHQHVGDQPDVQVIGDAVEAPTGERLPRSWHPGALMDELRLRLLDRRLQTDGVPAVRRAVWFGHHGSPNAEGGMSDLASIRPHFAKAMARAPVSLTVISNNSRKFHELRRNWPSPIYYLPWSATTFSQALRRHRVAVIPIRVDPFSRCKTSNRVATSLLHGLTVVADEIPSYREFEEAIFVGDWESNLEQALSGGDFLGPRVSRGVDLVHSRYSIDQISDKWRKVLSATFAKSPRPPET